MSFAEKLKQKALLKNSNQDSKDKLESNETPLTENEVPVSKETEPSSGTSANVTSRRTLENNKDESSLILLLSQVEPDPDQPRKSITEIDQKKVSLRRYGQLDPITVRPHPTKPNGYMIVHGERRWTALNELSEEDPVNFSTIRATLQDDENVHDKGERLTMQIISNLHRSDMDPLETFRALKKVMVLKGFKKQKDLVDYVGMSKGQVSKLMRFDGLSEEEIGQIESGEISAAVVRSEGIEVAKEKAVPLDGDKKEDKQVRVAKLSISMESATSLALILQQLADKNGLPSIDLGDQTKKELIAVLESRASEIAGSL